MNVNVSIAELTIEVESDGKKTRRVFNLPKRTIKIPECDDRIWDLPALFGAPETRAKRRISMKHIIPTEPTVTSEGVKHYMARTRHTNIDGDLPEGLRFYGSPKVYLLDGNHRWYTSKLKGRQYMWMEVEDVDMSLEDSLRAYQEERARWQKLEPVLS